MITKDRVYLKPRSQPAPAASHELEQTGCAVLPGVLGFDEIQRLTAEVDRVYADYPADNRAGESRTPEVDGEFRYEMLNRSALCQQLVSHRGMLDVIEPLLGEDCHVIANTCWRNPPIGEHPDGPGHGGGFWHIDAGPHIPRDPAIAWPAEIPYPVFAIGVHVYLKDCPLEAGPTGVIKGSHKSGSAPPAERFDDVSLTWQGEAVTPLLASAGDVALFVSDVWHRRLPTLAGDPGRLFVQIHYGRRDIAQRLRTTEQINQLSADALTRIESTRDAQVVGLHKPLFYDG